MARIFWAAAAALALSTVTTASAVAQEAPFPFRQGSYWDVSSIHVKDGGDLAYAKHLAANWVTAQEFAKSKGWIKGYYILTNEFPRNGEPSVYLVTIYDSVPTPAESEKRGEEMRAYQKKTIAQMQAESGSRADIRTIGSQMLLREQIKR